MCATTVVGSYKGSAGVEYKRPIVNVRPREGRVGRALWAQAVCVWQRWWRQECMLLEIIDNDNFNLVFELTKLRLVHSREIHIGRAVFQIILISPWFCTQRILTWPEIQPRMERQMRRRGGLTVWRAWPGRKMSYIDITHIFLVIVLHFCNWDNCMSLF